MRRNNTRSVDDGTCSLLMRCETSYDRLLPEARQRMGCRSAGLCRARMVVAFSMHVSRRLLRRNPQQNDLLDPKAWPPHIERRLVERRRLGVCEHREDQEVTCR